MHGLAEEDPAIQARARGFAGELIPFEASPEEAVGEQWGGLNIGHLYQVLDRLSRDGLIESGRQPQPVKPDRLVPRITPEGRAELDRWLGRGESGAHAWFCSRAASGSQVPLIIGGALSDARRKIPDVRQTAGTVRTGLR